MSNTNLQDLLSGGWFIFLAIAAVVVTITWIVWVLFPFTTSRKLSELIALQREQNRLLEDILNRSKATATPASSEVPEAQRAPRSETTNYLEESSGTSSKVLGFVAVIAIAVIMGFFLSR